MEWLSAVRGMVFIYQNQDLHDFNVSLIILRMDTLQMLTSVIRILMFVYGKVKSHK